MPEPALGRRSDLIREQASKLAVGVPRREADIVNLHGQDAVATGEARQSLKPYCQRSFQTDQYVQLDILNPYTVELLKSLPSLSTERGARLEEIAGDVPDLADVPPGCRFHPRCPRAFERCAQEVPPLDETGDGRRVACWLYDAGSA